MLYLPTSIVYNNNNNNVRVRVKINTLYLRIAYMLRVYYILYIIYTYISAERVCCIRTIYNDIVLSGRQ